jgi:hypothetical protein
MMMTSKIYNILSVFVKILGGAFKTLTLDYQTDSQAFFLSKNGQNTEGYFLIKQIL